jgi:cation transport regulator
MPYESIDDLPDSVKDNLPKQAREIYKEAYNTDYKQILSRG